MCFGDSVIYVKQKNHDPNRSANSIYISGGRHDFSLMIISSGKLGGGNIRKDCSPKEGTESFVQSWIQKCLL